MPLALSTESTVDEALELDVLAVSRPA